MLDRLISQAGLSHEDVAERLTVPVKMVRDWVEWKAVPTVEQCFELAKLLKVSLKMVYLALISE